MKAPCISLTLAIFLFCVPAPAHLMQTNGPAGVNTSLQSVDTAWVRSHGPDLVPGDDDAGYAIASDPDGNLYVTGISWHRDTEYDFATMKYNAAGMMQWVARYNGPANNDDWAYDVAVDCSGNVYVTGVSKGAQAGFASYATIKYDNSGLEQWVATYAGPRGFSSPSSLAVDPRGNVYVTGRSNSWWSEKGGSQSDFATIKYNASGVELWVARYVGPGHESGDAKAVAVDSSGNVYVAGYTTGSGTSTDYTTIKYNAFGEEQWVARYNGPGNERDLARTLAVDSSGNVYVGGQSTGDGGYDYALVKYNASGVEQWVARYDGPGNGPDVLEALAVDDSGNTYATGEAGGLDGFDICATIKYSSSGVEQWVSLHSGPKNTHARGWGIVLDHSGHAYVMGTSNSDYTTIAYDASGSEQWVSQYNGSGNLYNTPMGIALNKSGDVCVAGYSSTDAEGWINDCATICYSSSGLEKWVVRYDGTGSGEGGTALALDSSGCLQVTGYGEGVSTWCDYGTVKYDASGSEQWMASFNGYGAACDRATSLAVESAGNVFITGWSEGSSTGRDYATIKYNRAGVMQWVVRHNGPGNGNDEASSLAVDASGNVYVTGRSEGSGTSGDYATIKYNATGAEQWVARYNGPGNGEDAACALVLDGWRNVYVTGWCEGSGTGRDYATIKYDAAGVRQWIVRYNGPGNGNDEASSLTVDSSGNVYVTGRSEGSGTSSDYATVKYNAVGTEQWVARYNGPGNGQDVARALALDRGGNICVAGWSVGSNTGRDYATVKYNPGGVMQWVARYNGPSGGQDEAVSLGVDSSGNVYVTGGCEGSSSSRDIVTVKYDAQGDVQWVACYDAGQNEDDRPCAVTIDPQGNVYVAGTSSSSSSSMLTVIKYTQGSASGVGVDFTFPAQFSLFQNYPNPFNPSTTIRYGLPDRSRVTLTVFNTFGQQVAVLQNGEQEAGYHEVKFDGSGLSSGVYFYRIQAGSFVQTRKLLILR